MGVARQNSTRADELEERVVALYTAHREGIYRFLVGHGLRPAEAQDVTQEVFVDLFTALQKGTSVESPQGWLYAVAGRAAVDYWRRERRAIHIELDSEAGASVDPPSDEPSPEAWTGHQQRLRRIAAGMAELPKEQRLCVQLRMQGLKYREIGKVLGVATSTVADWLVAAVSHLRGIAQ